MFLEDFEVKFCDFYNKEIVCSGDCSKCQLQKFVDVLFDLDFDSDSDSDSDSDLDYDSDLYLV